MKKIVAAFMAICVLSAHSAAAQQYVTPLYSQNGFQPYAPASGGYAAPASSDYSGYGTAVYNGPNMPATQPASAPAPSTTGYAPAPAFTAEDAYAIQHPGRGYNWSGCYIGGYVGGAFGSQTHAQAPLSQGGTYPAGTPYNTTTLPNTYDTGESFIGGGTLGCNYEFPQRWGNGNGFVIGGEIEGGYMGVENSGIDPNSNNVYSDTRDQTKLGDWDMVLAGRAGIALNRFLVYGKFGAVLTDLNSSTLDTCSTAPCGSGTLNARYNKDLIDPAFGGGVEYALDSGWSIKAEYLFLDTDDSYDVCGPGGNTSSGSTFCSHHTLDGNHTIKFGLNYHFNDLAPRAPTAPRW